MAGTIEHYWNGTILTIISDSGTSSCDLQGVQGDTGPRGPQGPAGNIGVVGPAGPAGPEGPEGKVDYEVLKQYLPLAGGIMTGPLDMGSQKIGALATPEATTDAANKKYVDDAIANAVSGGKIDLSAYATVDYVKTYTPTAAKDAFKAMVHFSETEPENWANGDIWLKPAEE